MLERRLGVDLAPVHTARRLASKFSKEYIAASSIVKCCRDSQTSSATGPPGPTGGPGDSTALALVKVVTGPVAWMTGLLGQMCRDLLQAAVGPLDGPIIPRATGANTEL